MATIPQAVLRHQLPGDIPEWGNCRFSFDPKDSDYDWLVVYHDLPAKHGEARKHRHEKLACLASHTLLTTSEPSSIKHFGTTNVRQFGCVITSQEEWALPHPDRIYSQAEHWFYGWAVSASFHSMTSSRTRLWTRPTICPWCSRPSGCGTPCIINASTSCVS